MPPLQQTRKGWENEHLGKFLLSQICFLSNPINVGEDVGVDLVCTLFEPIEKNGCMQLFPRQAFAIQIKSSPKAISLGEQTAYFKGLELPFFMGVINREKNSLDIYSGELLPDFFATVTGRHWLKLAPQMTPIVHKPTGAWTVRGRHYTVPLPHIVTLAVGQTGGRTKTARKKLLNACDVMLKNIATKISREYVFEYPQANGKAYHRIIADDESAKAFRKNFVLRLAESFYNLRHLFDERRREFDRPEFEALERCFHAVRPLRYPRKPKKILMALYGDLKRAVDKEEALRSRKIAKRKRR